MVNGLIFYVSSSVKTFVSTDGTFQLTFPEDSKGVTDPPLTFTDGVQVFSVPVSILNLGTYSPSQLRFLLVV